MSYESAPDAESNKLYQEVLQTLQDIGEYSYEALVFGTVDVAIDKCSYPLFGLSQEAQMIFEGLDPKPRSVSSVDMELTYDRSRFQFNPQDIAVHLDTGYGITFSRLPFALDPQHPEKGNLYYPQLITPNNKTVTAPMEDGSERLASQSLVLEFMREIGIDIPMQPQRADWETIEDILQFSERWTAAAHHETQIDPYRQVRVEERLDGCGLMNDPDIEPLNSPSPVRQITVAIEDAKEATALPTHSLQMRLQADEAGEEPHFVELISVPLQHEPEFLGQEPKIRKELLDKACGLPPNHEILQLFRDAISQARTDELYSTNF